MKIEIKSPVLNLEINSDNMIDASDPDVQNLLRLLELFNKKVSLSSFIVDKESDHHTYEYEAKDGRIWKQKIYFNSEEPEMTFDVSDSWKLSEFQLHRPIRDQIIVKIIPKFTINNIECIWS